MSSFFTLTLDTTAPEIEVFIPQYVLASGDLDITVQGNEELEPSYQEFSLIDSKGQEHPFILTYFDKQFKGKVPLFNIPTGLLTVQVRVKDSVLNPSALIIQTLTVIKGARVKISSSVKARPMVLVVNSRIIESNIKIRPVGSEIKIRPIDSKIKTRPIEAVIN